MKWILPEAIEDVLPAEASRIERLRRGLLDVFASCGYELVMPPMVEFLESLLTGTGHDLDLRTFKLVDQISGRLMGLRADITPQVARIDAHLLNRRGVVRLCYSGSVLHARPAAPAATREPVQIGAEIFGHAGIESDLEVQRLLARSLEFAGVASPRIDLGHVAVFRSIVAAAGLKPDLEARLFIAIQAKDRSSIEKLTARLANRTRDALRLLPELYGGREVLALAARRLPKIPALARALRTLRRVVEASSLPVGIDLAELRGYRYHSGVVFDAWCTAPGRSAPILVARGGRYDDVGRSFGRPRPATGFSVELRELALAAAGAKPARRILAPLRPRDAALAALVGRLRAKGDVVIEEFPGHAGERHELGCDRRIEKRNGRWTVIGMTR